MALHLEEARFRFQEELALKNSLYSIAETVLGYALKWSGASAGIFLYAAPGSSQFEKVASIGVSNEEKSNASYCGRNGDHPFAEAVRTQKCIEIASPNEVSLMAYPLIDSGMTSAGFFLTFSPARHMDQATRDVLFWLTHQTETALFNKDGEGV
jgi:hypothetical protein